MTESAESVITRFIATWPRSDPEEMIEFSPTTPYGQTDQEEPIAEARQSRLNSVLWAS
jgi:hypothetical protein